MSENRNGYKKKILFVVEAMGGGVFTYIVALANTLSKEYDVFVAYALRPQTPKDYKYAFCEDVKLIQVANFTRSVNFYKDIKAFFEIRKIAKEIKPYLIHLHSSKAGAIGRFAFNGKRIPLYYTPHGYSFLMQDYSPLKRFVYRTIERICGMRHCITISCSQGEHEETLKINKHARVIDNGIDVTQLRLLLERFEPETEHPFTVFTLGRICYQKNPRMFNEIALALPHMRFLWIGDGELRDELTAPNIEITGWKERERALELSINTDVFILTSLWEGLPISLLEAMYMKKLCIVSDCVGNRDVIQTEKNGFVCKTADDYIQILKNLNDYPIEELCNNAYNDILNEYNTEIMGQEYIKIYEEKSKNA